MIPIAAAMLACPNLAMPAQLMYHVAEVESHFNPFAIGVVGGRLLRQPAGLDEAVATAQMLQAKGYNFSLGIAQVNRANLKKYGLDTYANAFDVCDNLAAGSRILAQCYAGAGGNWGKAFSCYYAGDYTTGFRDGYVQKVFAAFNRGFDVAQQRAATGHAIPLAPGNTHADTGSAHPPAAPHGSAAYRVAIRSMALDAAAETVVAPLAQKLAGQPTDAGVAQPAGPAASPSPARGSAPTATSTGVPASAVFRPQVTGPGDAQVATAIGNGETATNAGQANVGPQGTRDGAFVF